jgi:serine/threonine-protein kinase RsbW
MATPPLSTEVIEVAVPLRAKYASTLRVLVAALGADAGFSIDEIDDIKLAVTEVFSMTPDDVDGRRATISFWIGEAAMEVRMSVLNGTTTQPDELARAILDAVTDHYEIGDQTVVLRKRAVERAT